MTTFEKILLTLVPLEDANAVRAILNNRPEMKDKKPL